MRTSQRLLLGLSLAVVSTSSGCGVRSTVPAADAPGSAESATKAVEQPASAAALTPVTIGLPYRQDVQFTPIYVALAKGYYADRGLDVGVEYGSESDFVRLVAAGSLDAVVASGEQAILARADDMPVTYVMTWYRRFPGVVFSLDEEIRTPSDLVGRTVGLPAPSGASYIGWQALLSANDIAPRSVTTEIVGFEQRSAVLEGRVDAAVGYAANEPVQLRFDGREPSVIEIADSFDLVSNGLVVSSESIADREDVVAALVEGTLLGIRDTLADPDAAFEIALESVPEAADPAVRQRQREVLDASLRYWQSEPLGQIDAGQWQLSQDFLVEIGLLDHTLPLAGLIDDHFVVAADVRPGADQP